MHFKKLFFALLVLVPSLLAFANVPKKTQDKLPKVEDSQLRESLKKVSKNIETLEQRRLAAVAYMSLGEYGNAYFVLKEIPDSKRDPFIRALFYEIYSKLDMVPEAAKELQNITAIAIKGKDLALPKVLFCRKIMGFGMYNPFASNKFAASQLVLVYSEVDNFTRVKTDGAWKIDLNVGIVISTEIGAPLYRNDNFSAVHFNPKSATRDLWLTSRIRMPSVIEAGKNYKLIITVTDLNSKSVISKTVPFMGALE